VTKQTQMRETAKQLLANLSAAHLALGNWKRVIKYTSMVRRCALDQVALIC
jgi:hypothetical protein